MKTIRMLSILCWAFMLCLLMTKSASADVPMLTYKYSNGGWNEYASKWNGEHVALMVHGITANQDDMTELATHLINSGYYDAIYAVRYYLGFRLNDIGSTLASIISYSAGERKIDIFAHSMGGLVSREAIERPNGISSKVNVLVTMSTPHAGVTGSFVLYGTSFNPVNNSPYPEYQDLEPDSSFFRGLNAPTHTNCIYRSLIGADANQLSPYSPRNWISPPVYRLFFLYMTGEHDGMVETWSSGSFLGLECADYKSATLRFNHDWIKRYPAFGTN